MYVCMPVAAKVLGKVTITRIRDTVDIRLRQEQVGFRRGRGGGAIKQIFIMRNIIEQVFGISRRLLIALTELFYGK